MSEYRLEKIAEALMAHGVVTPPDVLSLRQCTYEDGAISRDEAEMLLRVEAACRTKCTEWNIYYIEALTDFLVHQEQPQGYVTDVNARWLIDHIMADGRIHSSTELELVVKVIEVARYCPQSLITFVMDAVKTAVLKGDGPLRSGSELTPGTIGASEVELLKRVLYGSGSGGTSAISLPEAELLFDINDATADSDNVPEWSDLFVKAIANHLLALSGYKAPPREDALRLENWLDQPNTSGFGDLFSAALTNGLRGVMGQYEKETAQDRALNRLEAQYREMVVNEAVTTAEADWVKDRIGRDGVLHDNERALLTFLKEDSPHICPSLHALLEDAA